VDSIAIAEGAMAEWWRARRLRTWAVSSLFTKMNPIRRLRHFLSFCTEHVPISGEYWRFDRAGISVSIKVIEEAIAAPTSQILHLPTRVAQLAS
jgi:hypothetical protein